MDLLSADRPEETNRSQRHRHGPLLLTAGAGTLLLLFLVFPGLVPHAVPAGPYVVLHTLFELLAVLVGFAAFAVQWHAASAGTGRDPRALFLGTAFFAVALLDTAHLLSFPGMPGLFEGSSTERTIHYWLAARLWASTALLLAVLWPSEREARWMRRAPLLALNLGIVIGTVLLERALPADRPLFFKEGTGLTPLKQGFEAGIIAVSAVALVLVLRRAHRTAERAATLLAGALALTILSELCLTLYGSVYDAFNLLGHLYKSLAYYLIFDALFIAAVLRPYEQLQATARQLSRSNQELGELRHHVEVELAQTIVQLRQTSESERHARHRAERAVHRLRAIESITEGALAHLKLDPLLNELLERICHVVRGDAAALLLFTLDGRSLTARAVYGVEPTEALAARVEVGHGLAGRIASSRRPILVPDVSQADVGPALVHSGVRSAVGIPLFVEGRVLGVLELGTFAPRHFDDEDVRLLQLVADRIGPTVERARLFAQLDAAVTSMADGLMTYSPDGHLIRANQAARELLGLTEEELATPGIAWLQKLAPEDERGRPLPLERLPLVRALGGDTVRGESLSLRVRGAKAWFSVSAAPIVGISGKILGATVTFTDQTALHQLQREREDVLHAVSHDLRTPLTSIQLQAQLLERRTAPDSAERRSVTAILTAARRMSSQIRDLVDSARLSAGQLRLERQPIRVEAFLSELLWRTAGTIDPARVQLEIEPGLPPAQADPGRLERIVTNLLTNALKYASSASPIRLRVRRDGEQLVFAVRDRGPGISPEVLPRLFERYFRARDSASRAEGMGLGLYIARILVEAHGGRIWAESTVGEGSTFFFTLPSASLPLSDGESLPAV